MTLVEFLLARLSEDEQDALPFRHRGGGVERWRTDESGGRVRLVEPDPLGNPDVIAEADTHMSAAHVARHDPARVLAEVAAKRRIMELHEIPCDECSSGEYVAIDQVDVPKHHGMEPCTTLRLLASPHAEHPEYREEWKP